MNISRVFRRVRQMKPQERRDATAAACLLLLFWLRLRLAGPSMLRRNPASASAQPASATELERSRALAHIVNATATRLLGPDQCLARSLALQWMLRRRGIASQLRVGVRRDGSRVSAHAWIECGGAPVNDALSIASQYAVFSDPLQLAERDL